MIVQTYIPALNYGIGLVVAQRKTDMIVFSITEAKQVLVRTACARLLSRVDDEA